MVWTSERLGYGAATNIGLRRATGPVVILLDTSVQPTGDLVTPIVRALDDPTVAVVGGWGIVSADLRKFEDAPAGDVDAIEGYVQGFRRADAASRGPLDERFRYYRNLDIWWSLVLRDEGEGEPAPASGQPRWPACGPPRPSRLPEPARRRARPAEQAQLLPDHRPVRLADGPPRQPLIGAGATPRSSSCCQTVSSGSRPPMATQAIGAARSVRTPVLNMTVRTASVYAVA